MSLTSKEERVLLGAYRDLDHLVNRFIPRHRNGRQILKKKNAKLGIIPLNLSGWLGHSPSASESVMYSRAYKSLEEKGLIEKIGRSRVTSSPRRMCLYGFQGQRPVRLPSPVQRAGYLKDTIIQGQRPGHLHLPDALLGRGQVAGALPLIRTLLLSQPVGLG
ncbi:MAG: hypothetical protein QGF00_34845 [Planctomycetota bacterium]|nr:hypothetical protein [Planctomycetota bacterium]MDP7254827.1 hypothetical protein [Planctomycetota bacterium]